MGEIDALLDTPNDYYLARLLVPYTDSRPSYVLAAVELSKTVFADVAASYQQPT